MFVKPFGDITYMSMNNGQKTAFTVHYLFKRRYYSVSCGRGVLVIAIRLRGLCIL